MGRGSGDQAPTPASWAGGVLRRAGGSRASRYAPIAVAMPAPAEVAVAYATIGRGRRSSQAADVGRALGWAGTR